LIDSADTLGLRDINQGRVARANAVRRKVDVELVVCDRPERGLEDADLDALIRQSIRAHGFENTILVYNKVDVRQSIYQLLEIG
jgi:predicted GTPase